MRSTRTNLLCLCPSLYVAAGRGMLTLTDKGYTDAGIGIPVPDKGPNPTPSTHVWGHTRRGDMCEAEPSDAAAALAAMASRLRNPSLTPIDFLDLVVLRYGFEVVGDALRPWLEDV